MSKLLPNALMIFARNPMQGKGKSRIARESSHMFALNCYQELLRSTINLLLRIDARKNLYFSDYIPEDFKDTEEFFVRCQEGRDLGERMKNAFTETLEGAQKAIFIESDCIELSSEIIEESFKALDQHDIVIGPAFDGGYYLLGMKKIHRSLFKDMQWGGRTVFADTMKEILKHNLSVHVLQKLHDVDQLEEIPEYFLKRLYDFNYHPGI